MWEYLIDPAKVVVCIPGAELLESQDERTFLGAVKVKLGPMTQSYKGLVKFTEVDEQARQVQRCRDGCVGDIGMPAEQLLNLLYLFSYICLIGILDFGFWILDYGNATRLNPKSKIQSGFASTIFHAALSPCSPMSLSNNGRAKIIG